MSKALQEDVANEKNDIVQVEEEGGVHQLPADEVQRLADLLDQARKATESEHKMTVWQAVKRYPKASAWSIAISFGVVMEGESTPILLLLCLLTSRLLRLRCGPIGKLLRLSRISKDLWHVAAQRHVSGPCTVAGGTGERILCRVNYGSAGGVSVLSTPNSR